LGGAVSYDWEPEPLTHSALLASVRKRERTKWLREIVGDDFFQAVEKVNLFHVPLDVRWHDSEKWNEMLVHLQRLRSLKELYISGRVSQETQERLAAALPKCDIVPITPRYNR
jgi:hypothetical protein